MPPATAAVSAPQPAAFTENRCLVTLAFVILLFILWGVAITMGDVLNQHFQHVLHVSRAQSGPVQFSIFRAYAVMNIPGGLFMKQFEYKNGVLLSLALYAAGAFLFVPPANAGSFSFFSRGPLRAGLRSGHARSRGAPLRGQPQ